MASKRRAAPESVPADEVRKRPSTHPWAFRARFRREAFGWESQPAIMRVREAVAEIKKVARREPLVAADGAVLFLERVSPALTHVDSSSGAIGSAVNRAIEELVPIIAGAPADERTREGWLERLYAARAADQIPYIEILGEFWGELCATREIASWWADREVGIPLRVFGDFTSPARSSYAFVTCTTCASRSTSPTDRARELAGSQVQVRREGVCFAPRKRDRAAREQRRGLVRVDTFDWTTADAQREFATEITETALFSVASAREVERFVR
jgi:hypothetical protein